jgi:TRAP-type C4-dicarboxylate transport system substrate-binding protein
MANQSWFDSLPADLQELVIEVGQEIGNVSTNTILDAGESTLTKFVARGGIVTELSGDEKAKFDKLMIEKVMPAMAHLFDADALDAAEAFVAN